MVAEVDLEMNLRVLRLETDENRTIGLLTIDNRFECYSLEDSAYVGKGCIPHGIYRVAITPSQRFGRRLPLLLNVPGFEGVRIHPGNTEKDTSGCILLGRSRSHDAVIESGTAVALAQMQIQRAIDAEQEVWCSVENLF